MKIAVIHICTGKYSIFWHEFYKTSEQFFYPSVEKKYFLFTDDEELIQHVKNDSKVQPYFQRLAGWPYDTLMRFNSFTSIQDLLKNYDFCYFWNANTIFLKAIDEKIIPFPTVENELVLWRHTLNYDAETGESFNPEQNLESEAYVSKTSKCHSYGGGFFGGTSNGFIKMSIILRDRVARDLEKGIIAIAHDQSHLVKYGTEVSCVEVPRNFVVSEEYMEGRNPFVIFANKQHYGGMHKLRDMPLSYRIKEKTVDIISVFIGAIGLKPLVKRILRK